MTSYFEGATVPDSLQHYFLGGGNDKGIILITSCVINIPWDDELISTSCPVKRGFSPSCPGNSLFDTAMFSNLYVILLISQGRFLSCLQPFCTKILPFHNASIQMLRHPLNSLYINMGIGHDFLQRKAFHSLEPGVTNLLDKSNWLNVCGGL